MDYRVGGFVAAAEGGLTGTREVIDGAEFGSLATRGGVGSVAIACGIVERAEAGRFGGAFVEGRSCERTGCCVVRRSMVGGIWSLLLGVLLLLLLWM